MYHIFLKSRIDAAKSHVTLVQIETVLVVLSLAILNPQLVGPPIPLQNWIHYAICK